MECNVRSNLLELTQDTKTIIEIHVKHDLSDTSLDNKVMNSSASSSDAAVSFP